MGFLRKHADHKLNTPKDSTAELVKYILEKYKDKYNVDMSDVEFIEDPIPRYTDGTPVGSEFKLPAGGSWTKNKKIYLAPDLKPAMAQFNVQEDEDKFRKRIIAHELGHEFYNNHADKKLKKAIFKEILKKKFSTAYLDEVPEDKKEEEAFAEYLADSIVEDDTYQQVLDIYNSLPENEQKYIAPRGKFVDSPNLVYRNVVDNKGFAELYDIANGKAFITLAVRPEAQGKGLGKALLADAIRAAKANKDIKSIVYKADNSNTASHKLINGLTSPTVSGNDFTEWELDTES